MLAKLLPSAETHEVTNQPPPLVDYNLFERDADLVEAVRREGAEWANAALIEFGKLVGSEEAIRWAFEANENPPVLHTHDRFGNRRDEVKFHPAWHELMRLSLEHGLHCLPWTEGRPGAHVARAALLMLAGQNEAGHTCPISMTYASVPLIRKQPEIASEWEARVLQPHYDQRFLPATEKLGALIGMAMTEKQGGSDVRTNTTTAEALGNGEYMLTGHKWFCSAPMCDAFLVLAQAPDGLSCFFLPRWTPDGEPNWFQLQRLKDKLGNRSNASGEVEFVGAWARILGPEGRGIATIMEMVNYTRLDCVLGSAGLMRQAVTQAIHHARHREAFGRLLVEQPVMQNVLADLYLESAAATVLAMRLARAVDRLGGSEQERRFARLAIPVAKYWITKRCAAHVGEALECLGGNGYVEECCLPRLYREAPVNSIWEGSANVNCLDILRVLRKEPESRENFFAEVRLAKGGDRLLDVKVDDLESTLTHDLADCDARRLAESLALALQASLLIRNSPRTVADAFCSSRIGGNWGQAFGTLPGNTDFRRIIDRAWA
ncbi:MAG: isovaleryl-CoA dehydrogenase [Acidobacteriaceae bacterium]|nr:isovaleryl-CoA dehydrogenase [Acidobacteriaceae bacterium]